MAINKELLGPNQGEEEAFAIEDLVFSIQIALQKAMSRKGISYKQLAERLGMSPARVSQIFSTSGPNLTVKTIARIAHALEEDFEFVRKQEMQAALPEAKAKDFRSVVIKHSKLWPSAWQEKAANGANLVMEDLAA